MVGLLRWKSNCLKDSIETPVDLCLKAIRVQIIDDREVRVSDPRVDKLPIKSNSFFNCLIACFIISTGVELLCSISSCDQVDNSLIPPITQLNCAPVGLI